MRLLHTSDWHLGHTLKDVAREHEHAAFLGWLLETCTREAPDAPRSAFRATSAVALPTKLAGRFCNYAKILYPGLDRGLLR